MDFKFLETLSFLGLGGGFLSGLLGTVPGAQICGKVSKMTNAKYLRVLIAIIIAITGLKMWYQVLTVHS